MDPLIRRKDAAKYLGISLPTIDRWAHKGTMPKPTKLGAAVGWRQSVLDAFLTKHTPAQ